MVREDIVSGFRNAIERGHTIEKAKKTLLNSGYSLNDVEEAARYLNSGISTYQIQQPNEKNFYEEHLNTQQPTQQSQVQFHHVGVENVEGKSHSVSILLLVLILLILMGILITSLIFKDQLVGFLQKFL